MHTTHIFKNGNSQAIRIPADLAYEHMDIDLEIEREGTGDIETGVVRGTFPKRALRAVLEWLDLHQDELQINWSLAQHDEPLQSISPLE